MQEIKFDPEKIEVGDLVRFSNQIEGKSHYDLVLKKGIFSVKVFCFFKKSIDYWSLSKNYTNNNAIIIKF